MATGKPGGALMVAAAYSDVHLAKEAMERGAIDIAMMLMHRALDAMLEIINDQKEEHPDGDSSGGDGDLPGIGVAGEDGT